MKGFHRRSRNDFLTRAPDRVEKQLSFRFESNKRELININRYFVLFDEDIKSVVCLATGP